MFSKAFIFISVFSHFSVADGENASKRIECISVIVGPKLSVSSKPLDFSSCVNKFF